MYIEMLYNYRSYRRKYISVLLRMYEIKQNKMKVSTLKEYPRFLQREEYKKHHCKAKNEIQEYVNNPTTPKN